MGDAAGIGPEVIERALAEPLGDGVVPIVYGAPSLWHEPKFEIVDVSRGDLDDVVPGRPDPRCARLQLAALEGAVEDAQRGRIDAIVTAPWTKSLFPLIGAPAAGHTEHLARLFGVGDDVCMMLAGDRLRVSLVTIHLPLREVAEAVTTERVERALRLTALGLRRYYGIPRPRIAVTGLNPHAGEHGHMGDEELVVIRPAMEAFAAEDEGASVEGPFPADTLFPRFRDDAPYDAVVAMYHDQGLIPLKTLHFGESANITLGLGVPRTSVDHGSAYDIAGLGVADASSMRYALETAVRFVRGARRHDDTSRETS